MADPKEKDWKKELADVVRGVIHEEQQPTQQKPGGTWVGAMGETPEERQGMADLEKAQQMRIEFESAMAGLGQQAPTQRTLGIGYADPAAGMQDFYEKAFAEAMQQKQMQESARQEAELAQQQFTQDFFDMARAAYGAEPIVQGTLVMLPDGNIVDTSDFESATDVMGGMDQMIRQRAATAAATQQPPIGAIR